MGTFEGRLVLTCILTVLGACGTAEDAREELIVCGGYERALGESLRQWMRTDQRGALAFIEAIGDSTDRELQDAEIPQAFGSASAIFGRSIFTPASENYRAAIEPPKFDRLTREGENLGQQHFSERDSGAIGRFVANCTRSYVSLSR